VCVPLNDVDLSKGHTRQRGGGREQERGREGEREREGVSERERERVKWHLLHQDRLSKEAPHLCCWVGWLSVSKKPGIPLLQM
jgi:hypothetical protein